MKVEKMQWMSREGGQGGRISDLGDAADLVLVFGGLSEIRAPQLRVGLRKAFPQALILGCSTAGEIFGTHVFDNSISVAAIDFEKTTIRAAHARCFEASQSLRVGAELAKRLPHAGLRHVLVLSPGLGVNGSELVKGLVSGLPQGTSVSGGLAGDGGRFQETWVLCGEAEGSDVIGVVGLYGDAIQVICSSLGGWDPFGPERLITKSRGNVLYEVDGEPALNLYKKYLGEKAKELPGSGLLFPLSLRTEPGKVGLVRTILSVDEATQSMTFAGDVPEGAYARLMRANFNRLIEGAQGAAEACSGSLRELHPQLALLISCVGRKMVLQQRVEEEVEAVREVLGDETALTGFYSYGEISPFTPEARCELHNQTMTITAFAESI